MTNRIAYYDILRGLAILGVIIIIHSSGEGLNFPNDSFNFYFTIFWRQLWNFSVPLFLVISGYFLVQKELLNFKDYNIFIKKQFFKIYIPMLFWSFAWLLVGILIFHESLFKEFIKLLIFQSSGPYYFIALIIQYYILLPFLKKLANKKGVIFTLIISLIMVNIIFYIRYFTDFKLYTIIYAGNALTWIVFFVLGLYLGSSKKVFLSNKLLLILIVGFYLASCIETYILYKQFNQIGDAVTSVKSTSFMFSFFLCLYLFKNTNFLKNKVLESIGKISFGIYLIHMFMIITLSFLLKKYLPNLIDIQFIYQILLAFLTMLFSYLIIFITRNFLHDKYIKLIGFK